MYASERRKCFLKNESRTFIMLERHTIKYLSFATIIYSYCVALFKQMQKHAMAKSKYIIGAGFQSTNATKIFKKYQDFKFVKH